MEVNDQRQWYYTKVENSVLDDENSFSVYEKMIYTCICRFANINTKKAFPSAARIARMSGCSERKVRQSIKSLEEKKTIHVHRKKGSVSVITLLPYTPAPHAGVEQTPAHGAEPPLHDVPDTPAHGADELERTNQKNITREKREATHTSEDKINQLKARYTKSEQRDLDDYFDMIHRTRARNKVADSVIVGILEEFAKHDKERVLYGIHKHTTNKNLHDKQEKYTYGIIRNATAEEMKKHDKKHKPGFFLNLADDVEEEQYEQT